MDREITVELVSFGAVVRIGQTLQGSNRAFDVFCKIEFENGKLSITGVEGPLASGNCRGGCGQIIMHEWKITKYAPGWNKETEQRFREIWDRWHLNDMVAGSPAQMEFLRDNPIPKEDYAYPKSHYDVASLVLERAGLNPDNGYKYGTRWLTEEVPADALEFLESLPSTDKKPAWV